MNTAENRLIAEFMNFVESPTTNKYWTNKSSEGFGIGELVDLQFHSDWNWLMQVVEKIESLDGHLHICDNAVFVHFPKRIKQCICINGSLKLSKIEAVYNACLEFIEWYNENKTK
jgi:hypothetical protein